MGFIELLFIAIGLSMDAFAVSVCKGLSMKRMNRSHAFVIALYFGFFQAAMPLIGWLLGKQFQHLITNVDHWIAFGLLAFIGGKMIRDSFDKDPKDFKNGYVLNHKELLVLAVATSIDALAVGITLAFLRVNIYYSIVAIGCTTFLLSFLGVFAGKAFGVRYRSKAEIAGGAILILMGLKILLEHLGIIPF